MSIKSKLWFILKVLFSIYLGSAVGYIIMSLGSTKTDYFLKAISPAVLYHEMITGNPLVILFAVLGVIIFLFFK
jgi:sorbitol-specific phosphotransferase system component IIBC